MAEGQGPARRKRLLTPEEKYEIWVQVLTRQLTQAEAAVRWGVDPTTVMKLRRVAKGCADGVGRGPSGTAPPARGGRRAGRGQSRGGPAGRGGQRAGGREPAAAGKIELGLIGG